MENYAINKTEQENIIDQICSYFKMKRPILSGIVLTDNIKELCVSRLCRAMGLNCAYNFKNSFFEFFATITGEAVCYELNLHMHVASDDLRLVRYGNINFVQYVIDLFDTEDLDEAIIDAFNFARKYYYVIKSIYE